MHCNHFPIHIYVEKTFEQWEALATTTHKKPWKVSNETGTQVISQTINKYRVKIIQRELYNVKNPLWKGDRRNSRKKDSILIYSCTQSELIYMNTKLLRLRICSYLSLKFNSNLLWTCDNFCSNLLRPSFPTHSLQIYCHGLIKSTYSTLKFGPQIETLQRVCFVGVKIGMMENRERKIRWKIAFFIIWLRRENKRDRK